MTPPIEHWSYSQKLESYVRETAEDDVWCHVWQDGDRWLASGYVGDYYMFDGESEPFESAEAAMRACNEIVERRPPANRGTHGF